MNRTILIAVCLLAAVPALGTGLFGGPPEPGKMPSRSVRFDGLELWGDGSDPSVKVSVDAWQPYLEPA